MNPQCVAYQFNTIVSGSSPKYAFPRPHARLVTHHIADRLHGTPTATLDREEFT
jgi:hypothetical protein